MDTIVPEIRLPGPTSRAELEQDLVDAQLPALRPVQPLISPLPVGTLATAAVTITDKATVTMRTAFHVRGRLA